MGQTRTRKKPSPTEEEVANWNKYAVSLFQLMKEELAKVEIRLNGDTPSDELARSITSAYKHVQVLVCFSSGEKKLILKPDEPALLGRNHIGCGSLPEHREYPSRGQVEAFIYGFIRGHRKASEELDVLKRKIQKLERNEGEFPFFPHGLFMRYPFR